MSTEAVIAQVKDELCRVLSLRPGDAFRVEDGTAYRVVHGPELAGHYFAYGPTGPRVHVPITRIVECL